MRWMGLLRQRSQRDFENEIESHIALETDRLAATGMPPDEARAAARRAFGNVGAARERFYESGRIIWLEHLVQDLRYTLRGLRQRPALTAAIVLTLAFGIGANTGIVTLLDFFLLRPLPVRDAGRVVNVYQTFAGKGMRETRTSYYYLSYPEYVDYLEATRSFEGLAVYREENLSLGLADGQAAQVGGMLVSCNYFTTLYVRVRLGRGFLPGECAHVGDGTVAVLGEGYWERQFGADSAIVGRTLVVNGVRLTVIGVAEAGFIGTSESLSRADVWIPITMHPTLAHGRDNIIMRPNASWLVAVGRLRPGVTRAQAEAELEVIAHRRDLTYPGRRSSIMVYDATLLNRPDFRNGSGIAIGGVVAMALLVTLMACANVMNLLFARAASRRREIGVRLAVGASRSRVVRQLLTESVLLALAGGIVGLLVARWIPPAIVASLPIVGEIAVDVTPDGRLLAYAGAIALSTALAFGLAPALQSTRLDLTRTLRVDGGAEGARTTATRTRSAIIGVQVAGSVLFLVIAALLVRGLLRAAGVDPGFETGSIVRVSLDLGRQGYDDVRARQFYEMLETRIAALPDVRGVSRAKVLPLSGRYTTTVYPLTGDSASPRDGVWTDENTVSPSYFTTMRIPLARGRVFVDAEARSADQLPAVVSEALAAKMWPGANPIAQRMKADGRVYYVTGITPDLHAVSLGTPDGPFIYLAASPDNVLGLSIVVRTSGDPASLATAIRALVRQMDSATLVTAVPLEESLARTLLPVRVVALLITACGALATFLALVGIYGVISYAASQRTREIGVRMALGAAPGDIVSLFLRQGARIVVGGAAAGLLMAGAASQVVRGMLFGVSPLDPIAFAAVAAIVLLSALAAIYRPARRASRIDPGVTLRAD